MPNLRKFSTRRIENFTDVKNDGEESLDGQRRTFTVIAMPRKRNALPFYIKIGSRMLTVCLERSKFTYEGGDLKR